MAFQLASRKKTFVLVGLTGHSGSGKTYSALRLARGMANGGKIGFIDTENGRGSAYAPELGPYYVDELHAPFSSLRYKEKFEACRSEGFSVLIIDSFSHEWEGTGGVLELAEEGGGKGLQKWNKPKVLHKKMLNVLLQLPLHVIVCLRGKDKMVQAKENGKDVIVNSGVVPIQDSRLLFEMTISCILNEKYECSYRKGPEPLRKFFHEKMITEDSGKALMSWVNEGAVISPSEKLAIEARGHATSGTDALMAYWNSLSVQQKQALKPQLEEIKLAAVQVDKEMKAAEETEHQPDEQQEGGSNVEDRADS